MYFWGSPMKSHEKRLIFVRKTFSAKITFFTVSFIFNFCPRAFRMASYFSILLIKQLSSPQIAGQRWLPVMIFFFNCGYLRNYRRYEKTINMFFVALNMYFPKIKIFLDFGVFKGLKRYSQKKKCHFWENVLFSRF